MRMGGQGQLGGGGGGKSGIHQGKWKAKVCYRRRVNVCKSQEREFRQYFTCACWGAGLKSCSLQNAKQEKAVITLPSAERKVHQSPGEFTPFPQVEITQERRIRLSAGSAAFTKHRAGCNSTNSDRENEIAAWPRDGGHSILQALQGLAEMWESTPWIEVWRPQLSCPVA